MQINNLLNRGMIEQISNYESIEKIFSEECVNIYVGFDPSAESLHVGHLLPIKVLSYMQKMGHRPIILVGGGTGMIGDPSGRVSERQFLNEEKVKNNTLSIQNQLKRFFSFSGDNSAIIVNNLEWLNKINLITWLRDVGKSFSINYMLSKDSVKIRLGEREQGISYTEFSYMLLQAYDFLQLFDNYNCKVQGGGNDQWGNITAGIDLVRKLRQKEVFGITFPLLTTSSGEKFGKAAGNAVWLDASLTSPYHFYQYWLNVDDRDVKKLLKFFTDLSLEEIANIMEHHIKNPEKRGAQRKLADLITEYVHGLEEVSSAKMLTNFFFGGRINKITKQDLLDILNMAPYFQLSNESMKNGYSLVDVLVDTKICKGRGEAKKMILGGGIYLNNIQVKNIDYKISSEDLIAENYIILRIGKKNYYLLEFLP